MPSLARKKALFSLRVQLSLCGLSDEDVSEANLYFSRRPRFTSDDLSKIRGLLSGITDRWTAETSDVAGSTPRRSRSPRDSDWAAGG